MQLPTPMGAPASGTPYLVPATNTNLFLKPSITHTHIFKNEDTQKPDECANREKVNIMLHL
jgi:hypothetical protein